MVRRFAGESKRICLYLDTPLIAYLEKEARRRYVTVSEITRDALRRYIEENNEKELSERERDSMQVGEADCQARIEDLTGKIEKYYWLTMKKLELADKMKREGVNEKTIINYLKEWKDTLRKVAVIERLEVSGFIEKIETELRVRYLYFKGYVVKP